MESSRSVRASTPRRLRFFACALSRSSFAHPPRLCEKQTTREQPWGAETPAGLFRIQPLRTNSGEDRLLDPYLKPFATVRSEAPHRA